MRFPTPRSCLGTGIGDFLQDWNFSLGILCSRMDFQPFSPCFHPFPNPGFELFPDFSPSLCLVIPQIKRSRCRSWRFFPLFFFGFPPLFNSQQFLRPGWERLEKIPQRNFPEFRFAFSLLQSTPRLMELQKIPLFFSPQGIRGIFWEFSSEESTAEGKKKKKAGKTSKGVGKIFQGDFPCMPWGAFLGFLSIPGISEHSRDF